MAFNLDNYILPDSSNNYGMEERFVTYIKNTANYNDTDLKTFQAIQDAANQHRYASQGYMTSLITGDTKIPLSEQQIKNFTFPGYEATPEGYEKLKQDLAFGPGTWFTPKSGAFDSLSDKQKQHLLRNTKNSSYETASGEQQNELFTNPRTEVGDAEKTITLPTESYGDLTVTSIPDMTYKGSDGFNQMYVDTDQGRFVFLTNDYLNKGFVEESPFAENRKFQNYSRGLLNPETRSEILGSAVPVDLSDIEGSLSDYGVSTGNNVSLDKLTNTQGILIPVEQAEKLDNAYSALGGTFNEIKGFAMVNGKPTYIEDDSYNTTIQYSETGNGAFSSINDTRNIVTDTGVRYQKGGMFDNFTGIGFIDNTLGGISDALAGVEDLGREGVEGVDAALQNPYVRAVVKTVAAVSPDPLTKAIAAGIDAYATVDSGDDLSASQVVNLATSAAGAYQASGGAGGTMSAEGGPPQVGGATETSTLDSVIQAATDETVQKIAGAGASIIDGADPIDVVVDVFSDEIIEGIANTADTTLGKEAGDAIRNNPKASNVILDLGTGKDVSETIVDTYADEIAETTGATTTNEIAGVKAALDFGVAKDQSQTTTDALFSATETYFDEGGTVDLELDGSLLGDTEAIFGDTGIDLDPLDLAQTASEALAAGEDVIREAGSALDDYVSEVIPGEDITQQLSENLSELTDQASNALAELEDTVSEAIPGEDITQQISEGAAKFEDNVVDALADVDDTISENLPEFDIPEGPDLPEVDGPDIDIDFDFDKKKGMLLDDETSPVFELAQYAFAQGLDPLGQIRPVLPRLNYYLTNNRK